MILSIGPQRMAIMLKSLEMTGAVQVGLPLGQCWQLSIGTATGTGSATTASKLLAEALRAAGHFDPNWVQPEACIHCQ